MMCSALKSLCDIQTIPSTPIQSENSLMEVLEENYEWMLNGMGEGLVLSMQSAFKFNQEEKKTEIIENNGQLLKWKCGIEECQKDQDILKESISMLNDEENDALPNKEI